jgi:hypothetical protein
LGESVNVHWEDTVSVKVLDETHRWARLSGLPAVLKQQAWVDINTNSPALATLLKDPLLQEIVRMFDAEIFVQAELVPGLPVEQLPGRKG